MTQHAPVNMDVALNKKRRDTFVEKDRKGIKVEGKELYRIVGTPDYMAPEMIKSTDVNNPSNDWWAIGCIIYELIVGMPPFNANTVEGVWDNVVNRRITWPNVGYEDDCITPEAKDLIEQLLELDLNKRLKDIEEFKAHPFFEGT